MKQVFFYKTFKLFNFSELEESLLVLPFDYVIDVLKLLLEWIKVK